MTVRESRYIEEEVMRAGKGTVRVVQYIADMTLCGV